MRWLYEDVIGPIEYLTNKAEKYYKYSPQPRHKYDICSARTSLDNG
jgi:hypothetical protein